MKILHCVYCSIDIVGESTENIRYLYIFLTTVFIIFKTSNADVESKRGRAFNGNIDTKVCRLALTEQLLIKRLGLGLIRSFDSFVADAVQFRKQESAPH